MHAVELDSTGDINLTYDKHSHHHRENMLSLEDALDRILNHFDVLDTEQKPILNSIGQVLAENTTSQFNIPPLDNSAMDGYGVQAHDLQSASSKAPIVLKVIGSIAAGELPDGEVRSGTAIRIMTGAPIPAGADAVVPFENTDEVKRRNSGLPIDEVTISTPVERGADIRPAGQDVKNGDLVLEKGCVLRPSEIGLLASLGLDVVPVIRRPIVAILSTGDELLIPGENPNHGKIYDSNSYSVAASVIRYGGIPRILGIARDNLQSMNSKLAEGLDSDLLITSAGVSKGDYDMVKDILAQHGKIDFWSVRMRPAKPIAFGALTKPDGGSVPHLGLPGNPVSAMVAFEQFGRPAIYKMLGRSEFHKPIIQAILDEPIHNFDGRRVFARAFITKNRGAYHAKLTGNQSSNLLTSMTRANGLAICPEDVSVKEVGEIVDVQMLDWPEEVF